MEEKINGRHFAEKGRREKGLLRLRKEEIVEIYETHMVQDFLKSELKPLSSILQMMDKGLYECLGFFAEGEMKAYVFSLTDRERGFLLLDYLAVCESHRGEGWGSHCIGMLREFYRKEKGLLLECESLESAENEEEREQRRRRIAFYEKNGCVCTGVKSRLFGVEFDILYLSLLKKQADAARELERLYRKMLPDKIYEKQVKIW
ncbi:MAG: N-acetyltransferase [Lachnospiraceae bacterium]|nr:N-acetyltransferase [Lachnospiraceae bacterium]